MLAVTHDPDCVRLHLHPIRISRLKSDAVLVANDKHFDRVKDEGIVEVWRISEAIERLL